MDDVVSPKGIVVPGRAVTFQFARSGGPGGQHVNTTSSKVLLRIALDECEMPGSARERLRAEVGSTLIVTSEQSRSQWRNRHLAMSRALSILDRALVAPTRRIPSKPSRSATQRRLTDKTRRSRIKADRRRKDDE